MFSKCLNLLLISLMLHNAQASSESSFEDNDDITTVSLTPVPGNKNALGSERGLLVHFPEEGYILMAQFKSHCKPMHLKLKPSKVTLSNCYGCYTYNAEKFKPLKNLLEGKISLSRPLNIANFLIVLGFKQWALRPDFYFHPADKYIILYLNNDDITFYDRLRLPEGRRDQDCKFEKRVVIHEDPGELLIINYHFSYITNNYIRNILQKCVISTTITVFSQGSDDDISQRWTLEENIIDQLKEV